MQESNSLVGGMLYLEVGGGRLAAKGDFTYNAGNPKRTTIIGSDGTHGASTEAQPASIEGAITVKRDTDVDGITCFADGTATVQLQNGKVFVLSEAYYVGEGNITTKENEMGVRFEGPRGGLI